MTIYYILFSFIFCLLYRYEIKLSQTKTITLDFKPLAVLLPILLIGLRKNVGSDYHGYVQFFDNLNTNRQVFFISFEKQMSAIGFEPAYTLINYLVKKSGLGVEIVFLISAGISLCFFYFGITKYSKKPSLSFVLFLIGGGYGFLVNGVRQGIAAAIFFYSCRYIIEKNFFRYLFFLIFAALFHFSALILVPVYFIARVNLPTLVYLFLYIFSFLLAFSGLAIWIIKEFLFAIPYYHVYLDQGSSLLTSTSDRLGTGLGFAFHGFVGLVMIFFRDKMLKKDNLTGTVFFNLYFIFLTTRLVFFDVYIFARVVYYFKWFFLLVIDRFVLCFDNKSRKAILLCIYLLYSILFIKDAIGPNSQIKYTLCCFK
jgi:transmembrane protein EpsG